MQWLVRSTAPHPSSDNRTNIETLVTKHFLEKTTGMLMRNAACLRILVALPVRNDLQIGQISQLDHERFTLVPLSADL